MPELQICGVNTELENCDQLLSKSNQSNQTGFRFHQYLWIANLVPITEVC